jgi:hypothetical protein
MTERFSYQREWDLDEMTIPYQLDGTAYSCNPWDYDNTQLHMATINTSTQLATLSTLDDIEIHTAFRKRQSHLKIISHLLTLSQKP